MLPDKHLFGKHQSRRGSWGIGQEMYSVFQLKFSLSSLYRNPLACNSSGLTIIKQVWQQLSGGIERENPFTKWQSGGIDARDEKNRWVDGGSQSGKAPESEQQYAALPSPGTNMHTNLFCAQSRKPAHPSPSIFLRSAALNTRHAILHLAVISGYVDAASVWEATHCRVISLTHYTVLSKLLCQSSGYTSVKTETVGVT